MPIGNEEAKVPSSGGRSIGTSFDVFGLAQLAVTVSETAALCALADNGKLGCLWK